MSTLTSHIQRDQALKLLSDVIGIITVNPEGEEKVLANFIASYLEDTGCFIEIEEFAEGRSNIIAKLKGRESGNALMLNGHLDTVPFGNLEGWETPPDKATVKNGILYGRGSSDMKSGLCAALYSFRQLVLEGFMPKNDIIFLGTGDEESLGLGAQAALERGLLEDVGRIIIGEPTDNGISVASKGTLWLEFTVSGKTSHGAYPWEGVNAAEIAYELFDQIRSLIGSDAHKYLSNPTCTLTKIQGGVKANMVPDMCTMTIDIRTVPGIIHDQFLKKVDELTIRIEKLHHGSKIEYNILTNRMAVELQAVHPLVQELSEAVQNVSGSKPKLTGTGFFSDASIFLKEYNIPTVLFGPGESSEAHKPNEKLSLEKYFESVECYYDFLKKQ
jgi:succinyl-diaminopimelate desuccinylase